MAPGERQIVVFPRWRHLNPYQTMLYLAAEAAGWTIGGAPHLDRLAAAVNRDLRPGDVLHVHWTAPVAGGAETRAEALARAERFDGLLAKARAGGVHVLWTVHNALAHDTPYDDVEVAIAESLARHATRIIQLHDHTRAYVADSYDLPADRLVTLPHASYQGIYPTAPSRAEARRRIGAPADAPIVALVGQLRPYKGVDVLLAAASAAATTVAGLTVLLAGQAPPEQHAALEAMMPSNVHVVRRLDFLPDAEVATWIQAADVVALPYRRVLNSGTLLLAATLGRRVLVPDDSGPALVYADQPWVSTFDTADPVAGLAHAIVATARPEPAHEEAALAFARSYTPYDMSRGYADILAGLAGEER